MIFFIWRGKGWLVLVVTFLSSLFSELLTRFITKDDNYYGERPLPLALAFFCSSIILYFIVQHLKSISHSKNDLLDSVEKPSDSYNKTDHSFFLVPMEYWILLIICFAFYVIYDRY